MNYHGSPHHRDSALWPVISQLRRGAGIEGEDRAQGKLDKLEGLLVRCGKGSAANVPAFAALLSIPAQGRYALPSLPPQRVKERILKALLQLWRELAADKPALIVFEDVHWLDPTSLELLSRAIDPAFRQRVLLLATARPEFSPSWPNYQRRDRPTLFIEELTKAILEGGLLRESHDARRCAFGAARSS